MRHSALVHIDMWHFAPPNNLRNIIVHIITPLTLKVLKNGHLIIVSHSVVGFPSFFVLWPCNDHRRVAPGLPFSFRAIQPSNHSLTDHFPNRIWRNGPCIGQL